MSYLKGTKNNTQYRFSIKSASDTTSGLFPAVKTVKFTSGNNVTIPLSNTNYVSGRTYYIRVKFRTRGDGDSTSSKCSSVGFIANKSDWSHSFSYIHNSATAYAERGKIVEWTYSFTPTADETRLTNLYFIINNGWANGNDNQTIDLFYYKFWDSEDNVYDEVDYWNKNLMLNETLDIPDVFVTHPAQSSSRYYTFMVNLENRNFKNKIDLQKSYTVEFDMRLRNSIHIDLSKSTVSFECFNSSYRIISQLSDTYSHFKFVGTFSSKSNTMIHFNIILNAKPTRSLPNYFGFTIQNLKLKEKTTYLPKFEQITKNDNVYYAKAYEFFSTRIFSKQIQLKKDIIGVKYFYLPQNASEYKYSELENRTYQTFYDNFDY